LLQVASQLPHVASLPRSASQPLTASASQSAKFASQLGEHRPDAHIVPPCMFVHERLQLPQLMVSLEVVASQPLLGSASQSA
jgi:hypothetical protein